MREAARALLQSFGPCLLLASASSCVLLLLDWSGFAPTLSRPLTNLPSIGTWVTFVGALWIFALASQRLVRRQPWRTVLSTGRSGATQTAALLAGIALMWLLVLNAIAWKRGIPLLTTFRFDPALYHADRWIHGGRDPWQYLAFLSARPWITLLDKFYALWYVAHVFVIVRLAWAPPSRRQSQFFLALALMWLCGAMIALCWPSAGPAFYADVTGQSGEFASLRQSLNSQPLIATLLQRELWAAYLSGASNLVAGISAFPSLHVAMPALYAVTMWSGSRRESIAWWGFTFLTLVGSVVLGWHYAVDGYAGVALSMVCWLLAGRVIPLSVAAPAGLQNSENLSRVA